MNEIPQFSYENLVKRSSTIDVIWFNQRKMPDSFFEIESTSDIQNSLLKFNDLQDFYARMVIVADEHRKTEFQSKLAYTAFKDLRESKRVDFLDYDSLIKQYEYTIQKNTYGVIL